jgi:hypothetical protein
MGKAEIEVKIYVEKLASLIHSDKNPRYIKSKKHQELVKSLKSFPEMKDIREIVIDENKIILAGDKRCYALDELGYTDVRVKQVIGLSDAKKREFIIKDNNHSGDWDTDILANEYDIDELQDWGTDFKFGSGADKEKDDKNDYQNHSVTCPECGHQFELSGADKE